MKVVIAIDSFKGSLTSLEAGKAAAEGVADALPDAGTCVLPIADGGEGTVDALAAALGGKKMTTVVNGPMGDQVSATYALCGDTAVIEVAEACGLTLVAPQDRNPLVATTYGVGQMIRDALVRGCRKIIIGLGGSATNDAGLGMLQALGWQFYDRHGDPVGLIPTACSSIVDIDSSQVHPMLSDCRFIVACDVSNPLTGPHGASHVFGPQKGATPEMVETLDKELAAFARVTEGNSASILNLSRSPVPSPLAGLSSFPGAGAAGGLGYAFLAYLRATLKPGIEIVLDELDFDRHLEGASLVITGEGRLDAQTVMGKAPSGILRHARAKGIPVVAIGGSIDPDAVGKLMEAGCKGVFPIVAGPCTLAEATRPDVAMSNIRRTVSQLVRVWACNQ